MALIIYPAVGWDSFVTVVNADLIIAANTVHSAEWMALTEPDKEIYLRIATMTILGGIDLVANPLPTPMLPCVADATAFVAVHNVVNQLSAGAASAASSGVIKSEKVGSLKVEYFEPQDGSVAKATNWIPASAYKCLDLLGYHRGSTGFKQIYLGRS